LAFGDGLFVDHGVILSAPGLAVLSWESVKVALHFDLFGRRVELVDYVSLLFVIHDIDLTLFVKVSLGKDFSFCISGVHVLANIEQVLWDFEQHIFINSVQHSQTLVFEIEIQSIVEIGGKQGWIARDGKSKEWVVGYLSLEVPSY